MAGVLHDELPTSGDLTGAWVADLTAAWDADLTAADVIAANDVIKRFVGSFEPGLYSGDDAKTLVRVFSEMKHAATSGIMLAARRVEETHLFEQEGHKAAPTFLASITGESVGSAASMLETAKSIEAHPAIEQAFRSGWLSEAKAKQIASAADARPDQAENLLDAAAQMELSGLRRHCADIRQSALSEHDSIDRYEQMRRRRYCRMWSDQEGFGRLEARLTPDALSVLSACLEPFQTAEFDRARKEGRHEPRHAYAADALIAMAKQSRSGDGSSKGQDTLVRVRVDLAALLRGHTEPGETCEIPGLAPLPVALVKQILGDSLLELVITQGKDVKTVCTNSRYIRRALRVALEERDQTCCVPECEMSDPLEIDHRSDYSKGGPTSEENLARLCPYHHHLKTHRGWRLEGGPGSWRFVRPDPPPRSDHPQHLEHREHGTGDQRADRPTAPRNGAARSRPSDAPTRASRMRAKRATGPPGQDTLL
jgi:HNH endonuclease